MNMHENQWIDRLISKKIVEEVPENLKISMEEQISLFYKQKRKKKEGIFERITRLYLNPIILIFAKNGLLALGLMACILFLAGVSTTTVSTNLSANSFIEMKSAISSITSLNNIKTANTDVFIKSQNGKEKKYKTIWKKGKLIHQRPEITNKHLENLLSPNKLKQILDNRLEFSKRKTNATSFLFNSPSFTSCKIILNNVDFLPKSIEGVLTSNGDEFKIIYNWEKRDILSLADRYFKRRTK